MWAEIVVSSKLSKLSVILRVLLSPPKDLGKEMCGTWSALGIGRNWKCPVPYCCWVCVFWRLQLGGGLIEAEELVLPLLSGVSALLVTVLQPPAQLETGGNGFIVKFCPLLMDTKVKTKSSNLHQKLWNNAAYKPTHWLMVSLFYYIARAFLSGNGDSTVGRAFSHDALIKTVLHSHGQRPIWSRQIQLKVSLLFLLLLLLFCKRL